MPATQFFGKVRHQAILDGKSYAAGATIVVPDFGNFQTLCTAGAIDDLVKGIATVGQLPKEAHLSRFEGGTADTINVQHVRAGS